MLVSEVKESFLPWALSCLQRKPAIHPTVLSGHIQCPAVGILRLGWLAGRASMGLALLITRGSWGERPRGHLSGQLSDAYLRGSFGSSLGWDPNMI